MEALKETVLITGITGYIGAQVAKTIIEESKGKY